MWTHNYIWRGRLGGTAFTNVAKPKNKATAPTSVMRLGFTIVERARVGVGERECVRA
jgi:hypothetical protein